MRASFICKDIVLYSLKSMGLIISILLFMNLFSEKGHSENINTEEVYKISELKKLALIHNPEIKSAFSLWKSEIEKIVVSKSLPDPRVSYSEYIEEVQTRVGPQRRKFSISQMYPWFGTLKLRGKLATARAELAERKMNKVQWKIMNKIENTVLDLNLLDKKIEINSSHLLILDDLEQSQKSMLASSKSNLSNVLRVQVERHKLKDQIATLNYLKKPLFQNLTSTVGTKLKKRIPQMKTEFGPVPSHLEMKEMFENNNPSLLANHSENIMKQEAVKLARKKSLPDIGFGFTWVDTGPASMSSTQGSGEDPMAISLSMNLPIWRSKIKSNIRSSRNSLESVISIKEGLLNQFDADLELHLFRINDADRKIKLYENELIPKAMDAYISTRKHHEAGKTSFQNLLDSERLVLRFKLDLEIALIDKAKGFSDLEENVGPLSKVEK